MATFQNQGDDEMSLFLFTFGQDHIHIYKTVGRRITLDRDSVVEIDAPNSGAARIKMFELFGRKWSMQYDGGKLNLEYFPRGIVLKLKVED